TSCTTSAGTSRWTACAPASRRTRPTRARGCRRPAGNPIRQAEPANAWSAWPCRTASEAPGDAGAQAPAVAVLRQRAGGRRPDQARRAGGADGHPARAQLPARAGEGRHVAQPTVRLVDGIAGARRLRLVDTEPGLHVAVAGGRQAGAEGPRRVG